MHGPMNVKFIMPTDFGSLLVVREASRNCMLCEYKSNDAFKYIFSQTHLSIKRSKLKFWASCINKALHVFED